MVCPVDFSFPGLGGVFFTAAGFVGFATGFVGAAIVCFGVAAGFAVVVGFAGVAGVTTFGFVGETSDGGVAGVDVASYSLTMLQMMKQITATDNSRRADVRHIRRGILWNVSSTPLEMFVRLLRKRSAAVGPPSS